MPPHAWFTCRAKVRGPFTGGLLFTRKSTMGNVIVFNGRHWIEDLTPEQAKAKYTITGKVARIDQEATENNYLYYLYY